MTNDVKQLTLLVVCHERLGQGLPDGVDLSNATTSLHPDPDVNIGESVLAQKQDRFLKLVLQGLRLNLDEGKTTSFKIGKHGNSTVRIIIQDT